MPHGHPSGTKLVKAGLPRRASGISGHAGEGGINAI